jgi:hypothetical protein
MDFGWFVVGLVVALITILPLVVRTMIFPEIVTWGHSIWSMFLYCVFDFAVVSIWVNYWLSVMLDPGRIPPTWV